MSYNIFIWAVLFVTIAIIGIICVGFLYTFCSICFDSISIRPENDRYWTTELFERARSSAFRETITAPAVMFSRNGSSVYFEAIPRERHAVTVV